LSEHGLLGNTIGFRCVSVDPWKQHRRSIPAGDNPGTRQRAYEFLRRIPGAGNELQKCRRSFDRRKIVFWLKHFQKEVFASADNAVVVGAPLRDATDPTIDAIVAHQVLGNDLIREHFT
jgi:hypothetical protein